LAQVLDYVKQLEERDVEGVEPMAHAVPIQNVFRKDEPRESMPRSEALDNAPESREQQFKVPQIIE
jgi:aspartyl-tRNA(Asn)/glutamyl-tRNA(Gln) amidotransferase subunit C